MLNAEARRDRQLNAAEGYLMLQMPEHALAALAEIPAAEQEAFEVAFLQGEALRALERHRDALRAFDRALRAQPDNESLLLAMAWCYKRTDQLPRAIASTEEAYRLNPKSALILYNLACYWSLAGNVEQALSWLGRALRMDQSFRELIAAETDFDPIRDDSGFQLLVRAVGQPPATA